MLRSLTVRTPRLSLPKACVTLCIVLVATLSASACGNKGPLYLPGPSAQPAGEPAGPSDAGKPDEQEEPA